MTWPIEDCAVPQAQIAIFKLIHFIDSRAFIVNGFQFQNTHRIQQFRLIDQHEVLFLGHSLLMVYHASVKRTQTRISEANLNSHSSERTPTQILDLPNRKFPFRRNPRLAHLVPLAPFGPFVTKGAKWAKRS